MKYFSFYILSLVCASNTLLHAQKVANVTNRQEQNAIVVSYDLETKSPCTISLFVSINNGETWQGPLKKVSGAVGQNIDSGAKSISWNVLDEFNELVGDKIIFKVSAQYMDAKLNPKIQEALKIKPTDIKTFKIRGEARMAVENYKGAVDDFTKAIALSPKNATLYKLRGEAHSNLYELKNAKSDYSKAIALNPNDDEAYLKRGKLADTIPENAISDFTKAITINPKNSTAYKLRASCYYVTKNYNKALDDLNQGLQLHPENSDEFLLSRCRAKAALEDTDGAINDLTDAININPKTDKGYYFRGVMKVLHKKDTIGGYEDFNQHINNSNDPIFACSEIAENRLINKDYKGALFYATKSIELDSIARIKSDSLMDPKSFIIRATTYMKLNKFEEAFKDYYRYVYDEKTKKYKQYEFDEIFSFNGHLSLGSYDLTDKEIWLLDRLIEKNPNYSYSYYLKGKVYDHKEEYYNAIKNYDKAIEFYLKQKEDNVNEFDYSRYEFYYSNRAEAKSALKDYTGAIADVNKAIEITSFVGYFNYQRAEYKFNLRDYRGAILDCDKFIISNSEYVYYYHYITRGDAKYNINDFKGAIQDYTKAISLNPNNAEAYLWRGHAKIQIKDKTGACKDFSKAGELGEKDAYEAINENCN